MKKTQLYGQIKIANDQRIQSWEQRNGKVPSDKIMYSYYVNQKDRDLYGDITAPARSEDEFIEIVNKHNDGFPMRP
ncbi:hypothetical protein VF04_36725 [Nostoc linckia z7]|uniref:Uncharacterized protein n=1 Tax=Nostoc linckia z7 TaxID=1628745 RepID=A0ABX4KBA0_NOSLI|nr:hypothetical protein [Nostoc linckia]PHJ51670.1 hypothetical protein VF02_37800 [Nostoc linckia z1]PHJ63629.1 hypothetical protein VF03_29960 [Nostoc linckia z2]PHJ70433.1 hypothetical protein VF06_37655 [Nostoc linckia z4]PHJ83477.1 hypothetical protein VF04_36725 [Nostoc linckia z7]